MDEKEKKVGLFARLKKVKHIEIIIAVFAVAIMLIIYFSGFLGGEGDINGSSKSASGSGSKPEYYSDYCQRMQDELGTLISKIEGAGNAQVLISWESSVELILAHNQNNSSSSSSNNPIIISSNGTSQPIVTKEIYPKALGVVIVCDGGSDARVKVSVIMSVSTLLDIVSDKVLVYPAAK